MAACRVLEIIDDGSEGDILTFRAEVEGHEVLVMAECLLEEAGLTLRGLHIEGPGPRMVGVAGLCALAAALMEAAGVDHVAIEGAARTTGAGPGRSPRRLRFSR
jgi:hypothetical protein